MKLCLLTLEEKKLHMQQLIEYMEGNGYDYEYDCDMSNVYFAKTLNYGLWYFALTAPHKGNGNRWMFRAENSRYFDRWSNASFEMFYDSKDDFIKHALNDIQKYRRRIQPFRIRPRKRQLI